MARRKKASLFDLNFLTSDWIINNLIFFLFLGFLATIYIANAHYAERNVRKIQLLQKEIKDLRWHYMSLQADNMYDSKRSEIYEQVKRKGLKSSSDELKKIIVSD
ncbi:MAG: FtsL-like putative cell division protein [Bacteroidota bacterium]